MNHKTLRTEQNNYLCLYLIKKNLKMKPVIRSMQNQLINGYQITEVQFSSIIRFVEREPEYVHRTTDEIFNHFSPLIRDYSSTSQTISLDAFMEQETSTCLTH